MSGKNEVVLEEAAHDAPFADIEELGALVSEGRERGYLTFEEIAACLEEVEVTKEQLQELGREPTPDEIAAQLECPVREVKDIQRLAQLPISLEKPIGEEDDSELGDFVEDEAADSPLDLAIENVRRENVRTALDALPEREREVIEMRFGLKGHEARTLEEVGRAFGVTRERIRQIENTTLKKLEALPEAQRLRDGA